MSGARIGRVRMKNGGADVRVLHTPEVQGMARAMVQDARDCAQKPVIAYALVAIRGDGCIYTSARTNFGDDALSLNRYSFVGMVTEALRDHIITQTAARDIVDEALGWNADE